MPLILPTSNGSSSSNMIGTGTPPVVCRNPSSLRSVNCALG